MKKILISFIVFLTTSYAQGEEIVIEPVPPQTAENIRIKAEKIAMKLRKQLMKEFMEASKKGGLIKAVEFCSKRAPEIEKEINSKLHGITVTRVSLKYRNPSHRPDKVDVKILKEFESYLKLGMLPPYRLIKVKKGNKQYYIYYKPLKVNTFCLKCHGNPQKMDKKILKTIKKFYPTDKALNYKIGDLRGACKVIIPVESKKGRE